MMSDVFFMGFVVGLAIAIFMYDEVQIIVFP